MKADINLAGERKIEKKQVDKVLIIFYGGFFILFLVAIFLMLYSFTLKARAAGIAEEATSLRNQITTSYSSQRENLLIVNERVASIKNVIEDRGDLNERVNSVLSSVPRSFGIQSFSIDDDVLSVRISSQSLSAFDVFLEEDIPAFVRNQSVVKAIEIRDFSQSGSGYTLTLDYRFTIKNN